MPDPTDVRYNTLDIGCQRNDCPKRADFHTSLHLRNRSEDPTSGCRDGTTFLCEDHWDELMSNADGQLPYTCHCGVRKEKPTDCVYWMRRLR